MLGGNFFLARPSLYKYRLYLILCPGVGGNYLISHLLLMITISQLLLMITTINGHLYKYEIWEPREYMYLEWIYCKISTKWILDLAISVSLPVISSLHKVWVQCFIKGQIRDQRSKGLIKWYCCNTIKIIRRYMSCRLCPNQWFPRERNSQKESLVGLNQEARMISPYRGGKTEDGAGRKK